MPSGVNIRKLSCLNLHDILSGQQPCSQSLHGRAQGQVIVETFSAEAPFPLARRVPGKTWKTVMDAWNGYHSVPLREEDRHLTTFITPFGRWRYTRAPQGYLSSGDGYNRRFDSILSDFERKERCVDDTIFYDTDLEGHWWRAIDFLIICGRAGIVINPAKFQFCKREGKSKLTKGIVGLNS